MNADAVAALLHDVLGAECSGTHSLGYATCQRQAAALAAAPLPSEPTHPHDGFAYDGCKCVCCVNIRALANPAIIEERDRAEEWADRLAYAIGGAAIGEHSNLNNPWQNALDMAAPLPSDTPARTMSFDSVNATGRPSDTPADGLDVCDCEPEHVWPCATIPRCDEPGCERETSCGFPTPAGYRRTCGDHYRAALALTQEPRSGDDR